MYANKFRLTGIVKGFLYVMLEQAEKRLAAHFEKKHRENFDKVVAHLCILNLASDNDVDAPLDFAKKKAGMRNDDDDTQIVEKIHVLRALIPDCPEPNSHCAARHEESKKRKYKRKHKIWGNKTVSTTRADKSSGMAASKPPQQDFDFMSA